ncbi:hypothetical protein [Paenibacillus sp. GM2FR]|uniref:hypothetical protein n=1 Tax=Paenibacillus sp. GM2FR TaxID=2059268 RepID=UPI000C275299|nr:hypothetical protein [Paenibacillus sp. GM2FR]
MGDAALRKFAVASSCKPERVTAWQQSKPGWRGIGGVGDAVFRKFAVASSCKPERVTVRPRSKPGWRGIGGVGDAVFRKFAVASSCKPERVTVWQQQDRTSDPLFSLWARFCRSIGHPFR